MGNAPSGAMNENDDDDADFFEVSQVLSLQFCNEVKQEVALEVQRAII
jgi:hypothetical protein